MEPIIATDITHVDDQPPRLVGVFPFDGQIDNGWTVRVWACNEQTDEPYYKVESGAHGKVGIFDNPVDAFDSAFERTAWNVTTEVRVP